MGFVALVLGLFTSVGGFGESLSHSVDIPIFALSIMSTVGSILAPWRKAASVTLLTLAALSFILIGYYTQQILNIGLGIMCVICAIFAAARKAY